MLRQLRIKNFALIDKFDVHFQPGLNILTGETGAGKSIIVNAFNLALGGRADPEFIRDGQDSATVEALFLVRGKAALITLASDRGVAVEEGELIIKRVLSRSGKNKIFINGSPTTLSVLQKIGAGLADIHGQHQHQALFQTEHHLRLLDAFGGTEEKCEEVRTLEEHYRALKNKVEGKEERARERARRKDRLRYELAEIKRIRPEPDEEERLAADIKKLLNAERLSKAAERAFGEIYEAEGSAMDIIRRACGSLEDASEIDPGLAPISQSADTILIHLDDLSSRLRDYARSIEFSPERLQETEDRAAEIRSLKRKYGPSVGDILNYLERGEHELELIETEEDDSDTLEQECEALRNQIQKKANRLALERERSAQGFSGLVEKELREMNMDKVAFQVQFRYEHPEDTPFHYKGEPVALNADGFGKAEFLFSSNPGERPKPLVKIASGGEISRVMLALKNILPGRADVPTMVFDEVDTGIGGEVAEKVGEKLERISQGRQVLCITHLPQIAGMAAAHYFIEKTVDKGRTKIAVRELSTEERIGEIARMSGGSVITETTRRHAKEMLKV